MTELSQTISGLALVDHHVHGATSDPLDRVELETMLTESDRPIPGFMSVFDSQVGLAIRRWCAPVLGLAPHATPEQYVNRRNQLGPVEVNRRLLEASGIGHFIIETGYRGDVIHGPQQMAEVTGCPVDEVVRVEAVMEDVARRQPTSAAFQEEFVRALEEASANAVGLKSIVAYRFGFDFDPQRPSKADVERAAATWLRQVEQSGVARVDDETLLRLGLWSAVDRGLPLQLHAGYGDADLDLHRCDPLLLMPWLRMIEPNGVDVLLLHCYPYHRNAGYLAQVLPNVYFDVGLGTNYTGLRSDAIIAESLELAPFSKILFSSDAWGPAELHHLGAVLWRRGMERTLGQWIADQECTEADAIRIARMIGIDNATRVYRLEERR